jgi:RHS repeat-associated protein
MTPPATYGGKKATTTYTYDQPEYSSGGKGNLTTVETPIYSSTGESKGTQVTHYIHGSSSHPGDVTSMIDPRGNTWTYTYDSYGDKTSETAPATSDNSESSGSHQNVTKWAYNTNTGWMAAKLSGRYTLAHPSETTCTPPAAGCTTYTYDNEGRLLTTTDGNGHIVTKHYNGDGDLEYEIDADSNKTTYEYNLDDQLTSTTRPDKSVVKTDYYPNGQVEDQIDAEGGDTHYTYDNLGHVSTITDPDGRTTGYQYGVAGELLAKADPGVSGCSPESKMDGCTTYEYNLEGRPTAIHYHDPNTHDISMTYDADGRRASMTDASGTSTWTYDSLGRVTQTTNGASATVSYGYDPAGDVTSIAYPGSTGTVERAYDPAGRIELITDWKGNKTTFVYDAEGNLAKGTDPTTGTAVTDTYTFDNAGAISGITTAQGATNLESFSYKRDGASQVTEATGSGALSESNTYGYNSLEQLSEANGSKYTYNSANGLTEQPGGSKQTYDPAGQLTSVTNGSASVGYTYDAKGERTSVGSNPASIAPDYSYGYNQAGELASVTRAPAAGPHASVAGGGGALFVVRDDGSVMAAGLNASGQLGDGTTTERRSPVLIRGLSGVRMVAAGPHLSSESASDMLAVTNAGALWATGANTDGELGDGTTTARSTPELIGGLSSVVQASEGLNYSLAVQSNGDAWAWGSNSYGQLGLGSMTNEHTPQQITGLSNVTQVAAGIFTGYALESNGSLWAWGDNNHGQLGNGTTTNETSPHEVPSLSGVTQVAAGNDDVLVVKSDGSVWAWGANEDGKLGDGTTTDHHSPEKITVLEGVDVVQVIAGQGFSAALAQNGTVYAWGNNNRGQLANGKEGEDILTPAQVPGLSGVSQIATGGANTIAVVNGSIEVWGQNTNGELGDGGTTNKDAPEQANVFLAGTRISLAAGGGDVFVVRDDGSVMAAGANASGQLGDGTTSERRSPVAIRGLSGVRMVAAGPRLTSENPSDTLAVTTSGALWATGANVDGELGDGTTTARSTPELISGISSVAQASEGFDYSLAVKSNGSVWSWGENNYGQLGLGSTTNEHTPQQVTSLSNIVSVAAGVYTGYAVQSNGTLWAWGDNNHGQLGNGNTTNESSPHEVPGLSGITQVSGGNGYVLALKAGGSVWAWGANENGKLGDGTTTERHSPEKITALEGVDIVQVLAGQSFSAALAQNGTVYMWGSNGKGQFGNGSESEGSLTPVQITGLSGVSQIAAGGATVLALANNAIEVWGQNTNGELGDTTTTNKDTPEQAPWFEQGTPNTASYTYNGEGLRTSKTVNSTTENFTWDTVTNSVPAILTGGSTSYIYGPNGTPLEQMNASGELLWYHHDQQGSTRLLTNNTGAVVGTASYNPYGQTTSTTGTTTPLGYDGQYTDPETGFIYLRARYYDPATGQFITRDPATPITTEPYLYVGDNPLDQTDPTGLSFLGIAEEAVPIVIGVVATGACVAQAELCVAAALADAVANSMMTGIELGTGRIHLATAVKNEVWTLASDGVAIIGATFWTKLADWAQENKSA